MVNFGRMYSASRLAKSLMFNRFFVPLFSERAEMRQPQFVIFSSDLIGQGINFYGFWEHEELTALAEWLQRSGSTGGTMLDVGANIGNHSVFFSRLYERVHAIEPNPRTYDVLSLNASLVPNMTCFQIAASDNNGSARFLQERSNVGHSRIVDGSSDETGTIKVDCWRLDDYFPDLDDLKLVKIDVEGHEVRAIAGMEKLLARCSPVVLFEQQPENFVNGRSPAVEILRKNGYTEFYSVDRIPDTHRGGASGKLWFFTCSFLVGFRLAVRKRETVEPAFYEMLIAKKPRH